MMLNVVSNLRALAAVSNGCLRCESCATGLTYHRHDQPTDQPTLRTLCLLATCAHWNEPARRVSYNAGCARCGEADGAGALTCCKQRCSCCADGSSQWKPGSAARHCVNFTHLVNARAVMRLLRENGEHARECAHTWWPGAMRRQA
jgi:hypothetical protein